MFFVFFRFSLDVLVILRVLFRLEKNEVRIFFVSRGVCRESTGRGLGVGFFLGIRSLVFLYLFYSFGNLGLRRG